METKEEKVYTEEERQELAMKLDQELDEFISGLEQKTYTEGWPEDRWREEMEKHPFFMTKMPGEGEEMSPLIEGIQQLKYDPLENTPEELASTYKDEGNFNFKCKKYRAAIINYTEGLKIKCADDDINAQLYNNRAASNFFLKNYRSCIIDCKKAIELNSKYSKAKYRAAQCFYQLEKFDECLQYCDEFLLDNPNDNSVVQLRSDCIAKQKEKLRNERKFKNQMKSLILDKEKILKVVKDRGIKLTTSSGKSQVETFSDIEPNFPEVTLKPVHLDENDRLIWPVLFLYPEFKMTDFVQEFHEDVSFDEMFEEMFSESPAWDFERKYRVGNLSLYFQDCNIKPQSVDTKSTLGSVLCHPRLVILGGTPAFSILIQGSKEENLFLKDYD